MTVGKELNTKWIVADVDSSAVARLVAELNVPSLVATVLVRKGFSEPDAAYKFLNPSLDQLHDPFSLPDIRPAIEAILGAKERGERIFIHGDYDVDGVTSTALFTRFLQKIECEVLPHVPHRMIEGYGIHLDAVQRAKESGAKLFLTCDCGVSAHEQVQAAREAGMQVVVTDHHQVPLALPEALAVVNPHRRDSDYPFKSLCGAGVVFKVCAAIVKELGLSLDQYYRAYLDLAVLGTVADVMPLVDENRNITKFGLERLQQTKKEGLKALLAVSSLSVGGPPLTTSDIGFRLGPRLNAPGRLEDAALSLRLLLEQDSATAMEIALQLDQINQDRRDQQSAIQEEAIACVEATGQQSQLAIIVDGTNWHPGIIGIVAGKIREQFGRPAFVIAVNGEEGTARGSARGMHPFDISAALRELRHLASGGGHKLAGGFDIEPDKIPDFRSAMHAYAASVMRAEDLVPAIEVDAEVDPDTAEFSSAEALERLEPYGEGNSEPLLLAKGIEVVSVTPKRDPKHCGVLFSTPSGQTRRAINFYDGERVARDLTVGTRQDVVFKLGINTFNGSRELQWTLVDFRPSD